ncbi:MAG: glycosyltransferase family 4 protein [Magnetococcales bacterium]|nr:glycosyltransferase family 4 protein [Magnetococcales bacterium]
MKPLIVYHLLFNHVKGGIHTMVSTLSNSLANSGGVVLFRVGLWEDAQWHSRVEEGVVHCCKRVRMPWDRRRPIRGFLAWLWAFPQSWRELLRLVREEKIEVIHLNGLYDHQLFFLLLARYLSLPCVLTLHGSEMLKFAQRRPVQRWINRFVLRRVDAISCVSAPLLSALKQHVPEVSGSVIGNGIDGKSVAKLAQSSCSLSLPERYFLLVGHLLPVKGQDVAVAAWERVVREQPELHLVIVGHPSMVGEEAFAEQVRERASQKEVVDHIHFLGVQPPSRMLPILHRAMALLVPSRSEGLPYVLLEAGALGKPLIASDIPPFSDLFSEVPGCFLFPRESETELARLVVEKSAEPEKLVQAGRELAKVIHRDYSAESMARNYQHLYAQAAQGYGAGKKSQDV